MGKVGVCIVPECLNVYYPGSRTFFHPIPKTIRKKESWLKSLNLKLKDVYVGARICHLHFDSTDYVNNNPETHVLKYNAIPALNKHRMYMDHDSDAESTSDINKVSINDIDKILDNLSGESSPAHITDISDANDDNSIDEFSSGTTSLDTEGVKKKKANPKKSQEKEISEPNVAKKKTNITKRVMILYPEEKNHNFVVESETVEQDDVENVVTQESESDCIEEDDVENVLKQVCRTCLATECKMYSIKQCDFERAYILLTGICSDMFDETTKMPQMLCFECVRRLRNFIDFSAKSITASLLLMELIQGNKLTMADIKSIDRQQNMLESTLASIHYDSNHFNIQLQEQDKDSTKDPFDQDVDILGNENEHGIKDIEAPNNQDSTKATDEPMDVDFDDNKQVDPIDFGQGLTLDDRREQDEESDKWEEEEIEDNLPPIKQVARVYSRDFNEVFNENEYCFMGIKDKKKQNIEFKKMFIVKPMTLEEQREEIKTKKYGREYIKANFKCEKCYKGYQLEEPFLQHLKRHTIEHGEYVCDICQLHFKTREQVYSHIRSTHNEFYSCRKCSFVTTSRPNAFTHKNYHDGFHFQCKMCPKYYTQYKAYLDHIRKIHPEDCICHLCGLSFALIRDFDRHLKLVHRMENLHLLPATESSPYGEVRRTKTTFYVAVSFVTTLPEDAPYCPTCDVRFLDEEALRKHLSHSPSHGNDPVYKTRRRIKKSSYYTKKKNSQDNKTEETDQPVTCEQCGEVFINFRSYGCHFGLQHPYKVRAQYPADQQRRYYMCDVCGKICQDIYRFRDHCESHNGKQHPCDKCKKKFSTKRALYSHRINHTHSRQCTVCGKKFRLFTTLTKHMASHKHKPYSCEICDARFTTQSDKQSHVRHKHKGVPWPKKRPKDAPRTQRKRWSSSSSSSS